MFLSFNSSDCIVPLKGMPGKSLPQVPRNLQTHLQMEVIWHIKVILYLEMTFGRELVVLHTTFPYSVSFRCMLGCSVEVCMKNILYWFIKRCYNEVGAQCTEIGCSSFKFKHYHTSGERLLLLYGPTITLSMKILYANNCI
jgi:hypothetical protein